MAETGIPLLATKLNIPPPRPNLVPRPQLMALLGEGLHRKNRLTLVTAKAGSGKTTLVSEWLHVAVTPATWLSLDENDNDPRRFLGYLVAALAKLGVQVDQSALAQPNASQLPQPEALAARLINDLSGSAGPLILVLDDYHVIQSAWIHQAVRFLIEHQPPQMHLVLVTRVDPPFPLARLRGRGQITEIRDHHLRFTAGEVDEFFNTVMELGLSSDAISVLEERTEGWIVGLQMAAISMQSRKRGGDLGAFIKAFGGDDRFVLDYLMEEVLRQQSPTIEQFLVETSILGRMCGALCDAVLGDGASVRIGSPEGQLAQALDGQAILGQLETANLFVTPLDDRRRWYRYHHLFSDLLGTMLRQRKSPEEIRELHRRASQWHQAEGTLEEAMIHAMAAQDYERAAGMIDENIARMLSRSEAPVLLGWIQKLPEHIVRGRPWIDVYRATALALSGRIEQLEPMLDDAAARIEPGSPRAHELLGHIAAIRAYAANLRGETDRVIELAALTDTYLSDEHMNGRGMVAYALAETCFATDDMEGASRASLRMLEVGEKTGWLLMAVPALCTLAATRRAQGRLQDALELLESAHRWMAERDGLDFRVRCPYETGTADLLRERNQLDAALQHANTGIAYSERYGVYSVLVSGYLALMRILQAQGDGEGALNALGQAERIAHSQAIRLATSIELKTSRVTQWLSVGDTETAGHWARSCDGHSELEQIALARLMLAQGRQPEALRRLAQQRELAIAGGRHGRLIEILALQAVALKAQDQIEEATNALSQAISLAMPEGYMRVFLDLGHPLCELLAQMSARPALSRAHPSLSAPLGRDYVGQLMEAFERERQARGSERSPAPSSARPLDALTERELEVLHLLALGLSNREMADRMIVAPSTVKQHLKNIYAKLDVHSRTQAVARGRELDLL